MMKSDSLELDSIGVSVHENGKLSEAVLYMPAIPDFDQQKLQFRVAKRSVLGLHSCTYVGRRAARGLRLIYLPDLQPWQPYIRNGNGRTNHEQGRSREVATFGIDFASLTD